MTDEVRLIAEMRREFVINISGEKRMAEMNGTELTAAVLAAVREINIENAEKRAPVYTLAEMLSAKNITSLRKIGRLYKVSGFSKMDKQAIIPALIEKMTDPDMLAELLFIAAEFEWKLFKQAVKADHVLDDDLFSDNYRLLLGLGILGMYYHNEHFYYVIPAEIQRAYEKLAASGFPAEKEHADLLNAYAIAAANLYGVIGQEDFVELFNSQNKRKTNTDEMFGVLIKYVAMEYGYCFWDEYLVNDDFEENDYKDVAHCAKVAASKPRYIPSKQEFLKYADWDYVEETPQLIRLRAYINHNLSDDPELTEDILEEICFLAKREAKSQSYIDVFEENEIFLEFEQLQALMNLIIELSNNTRLWLNNGHTPRELFKKERRHLRPLPEEPIKVIKVGRNEPCPCGSGKKYKNCCGR